MNQIKLASSKQKLQMLFQTRQFEKAKKLAEQLVKKNPKDSQLLIILAQLQEQAGEWSRAVDTYYGASQSTKNSNISLAVLEKIIDICSKQRLHKIGLVPAKSFVKSNPSCRITIVINWKTIEQ